MRCSHRTPSCQLCHGSDQDFGQQAHVDFWRRIFDQTAAHYWISVVLDLRSHVYHDLTESAPHSIGISHLLVCSFGGNSVSIPSFADPRNQ